MDLLLEGYRRFRANGYLHKRELFNVLSNHGQAPRAMIIGCCDSRVDPERVFDAGPGEIFVVRNVANLVPPYAPNTDYHGTSAAIEYAVRVLLVEHVIVLGHAGCGGVKALMNPPAVAGSDFIPQWMQIAAPARENVLAHAHEHNAGEVMHLAEMEALRVSVGNLLTFPWLKERVDRHALSVHGWYFDLDEARLHRLNHDSGQFEAVPVEHPEPIGLGT